jgi:hypothetical protein
MSGLGFEFDGAGAGGVPPVAGEGAAGAAGSGIAPAGNDPKAGDASLPADPASSAPGGLGGVTGLAESGAAALGAFGDDLRPPAL